MGNRLHRLRRQRLRHDRRPVWPDVGIKSGHILPKTYLKSSQISFYLKCDPFINYWESLQIFGLLLCRNLPHWTFKNLPIWSHCCRHMADDWKGKAVVVVVDVAEIILVSVRCRHRTDSTNRPIILYKCTYNITQCTYTRWIFFTYICCKNCNDVCLKRPKIN